MGDSPVLLCGDFNARISDKSDFIDSLDSVSKRTHLDTSSNSHGENFIDFLKDSCCYVLNGRFDATNDNYTCISQRGKSVVDYMVCSGSTFSKISDFRVMTMTDVIDGLNLISTISERSKPSDHSVLCCTLEMSSYDLLRREPNNRDQPTSKSVIRKYNVETIPKEFLSRPSVSRALFSVVQNLEAVNLRQNNIDVIYSELVAGIHDEMDNILQHRDVCTTRKLRNKHRCRPYWSDSLASLWDEARKAEQLYLRAKSRQLKKLLREEYKLKRRVFDQTLRKQERLFNTSVRDKIDACNPKQFWDYIRRLGPAKREPVGKSVILDDGTESTDQAVILTKWREDFESLFSGTVDDENFDDDFLQRCEELYTNRNNNVPAYCELDTGSNIWSDILNSPLDIEETRNALQRAKLGKAVGVDNLPNEILKRPELLHVLHRLYSTCYEQNVIPTPWYKSIICPIPKKGKDSRYPLNHRAISLMSTVAKVFSDIINNRIVYYMETMQLFADEQNGFRRMRSCLDHLYVLTTIIRNRKRDNLSTYVCYIDFTRAFDSIKYSEYN